MKSLSVILLISVSLSSLLSSCNNTKNETVALNSITNPAEKITVKDRNLTQEFKDYWYAGNAEITSYKLEQARYGEIHQGTAVTIFVTEDFLPNKQVKADNFSEKNIPVLKLNAMKKFLTGIYPYSIMTSTFNPVSSKGHALKLTNTSQEWCGHVFTQLNNKKKFEVDSYSYFESEGDTSISLEKNWLEDELWNIMRINPEELPTGTLDLIPSFEFLRLRHKEMKAYPAYLTLKQGDSLSIYKIEYPDLSRSLTIYFSSTFPYKIEKWEETSLSGFGSNDEALTTTATKLKRIKTPYWSQNGNKDLIMRDSLGLK